VARITRVACFAAVLALASAGTTNASTPVTVNYAGCYFGNGGYATVAPDSAVSIRYALGAVTYGQLRSTLLSTTITVSVDQGPAIQAGRFSAPIELPGGWASFWTYDTGRVLASGQSLTVRLTHTVSRTIVDGGRDDSGRLIKYGPGSVLDPNSFCTVSAA